MYLSIKSLLFCSTIVCLALFGRLSHGGKTTEGQQWGSSSAPAKTFPFETIEDEDNYIRRHLLESIEVVKDEVERSVLEWEKHGYVSEEKNTDECSSSGNVGQIGDYLQDLEPVLHLDDSERCSVCTLLIGLLRSLVCRVPHQTAVDLCIRLCEVVLENTNSRQGMCNGTITIQAPYVFTTLKQSTPYDFCESLNRCIPPLTESMPPLHDRIRNLLSSSASSSSLEHNEQVLSSHADNSIKLLHVTDIHISPRYAIGSATDCNMYVCCLEEYEGKGEARTYGEYTCNIPERTMRHMMDEIIKLEPDFIIFSGDAPPHIIWDETLESQLNCTRILVDVLKEKFPDKVIYPSIGNHEMFPTNVYSNLANTTRTMNSEFTDLWRDLARFEQEQEATMRHLGYYTTLVPDIKGLRLLSVNTNHYWYTLNFVCTLNRNSTDEATHRQFITDTLSQARSVNEKVIVVSHHPVGGADHIVRVSKWWESLVLDYSDVIIMHISGHTHKDEFHLYLDPVTAEARAVNLVTTSLSTNTNVNPSFKMFYLDKNSLDIVNIESYYMEVDDQKPEVPPPVVRTYDARELYGMSDFSPRAWKDFSVRLYEDDSLFQTWYDNKAGRSMLSTCPDECRIYEICRMWFPNFDEVEECQKLLTLPEPTPTPTPTTPVDGGGQLTSTPPPLPIISGLAVLTISVWIYF